MNYPLLTAKDVADLLNVKRSTVYEWARMDYIPCLQLGTGNRKPCLRFDRSEVDKWLAAKKTSGRTSRIPESELD